MYTLHHIFYNFDTGGAQKRLGDFIDYTSDVFTHYITALNGDYSHLTKSDFNATIYNIPYTKGHLLENIKTLRHYIKALNSDCVLTHNFGTLEAIIANTPQIVSHIHNEDGFGVDEQKTLKWKRNWLRKIFLINKTTIVPSQTLEKIAKTYWATYNHKIVFVPNGVPEFDNYTECPFDNFGKITIGTVAICRPEKKLHVFIKMIADLKQQNIPVFGVLVGDGSELNNLKDYALETGLTQQDFLFAGYQENHRKFTAFLNIFALCSVTEQQPFGVLDAMAAGLPVIATNVGDIMNMVSSDNQKFIDNSIFDSNIDKIIELINNNDSRKQIGLKNLSQYQDYYQLKQSLNMRRQIIIDCIMIKNRLNNGLNNE
jgi:glycosyltransferase involved in cell wall biosynthesis